MPKFKLYLLSAEDREKEVEGETLEQACLNANLTSNDLMGLDYYTTENGEKVQVFCEADCGCVHSAEDGITCIHDLEMVGILYTRTPDFLRR